MKYHFVVVKTNEGIVVLTARKNSDIRFGTKDVNILEKPI
jgi:hypothetical protein